ncbi:hypothetical protein MP228_009656 [Amoeboaphelidium protococcarum]|nr:hypothetical protein MP228_009656 [Amoeboaphelidium protococcarum]
MMSPTKDSLIALLKRLKLVDLVNQLEQDIFTFEQMMRLNRAQWKETAGTVKGICIYNHFHPTSAISGYSGGSFAFGVGDGYYIQIIPLSSMFGANHKIAKVVNIGASLSPYINKVDRIYVRDAYIRMFDAIYNNGNPPPQWKVLVSGTPGIGKTLFLIYCAYRLVTEYGKTVFLHLSTAQYKFIISPEGVQMIPNVAFKFPKGDDWYYLVDSLDPGSISCAMTILTVAPGSRCTNQYAKDASPFYYMPLWSWKQVEQAVSVLELQYDMSMLKHRFDILGGVPRQLFYTFELPERIVLNALGHTKISELFVWPEGGQMENAAHNLIHYDATDDYRDFTPRYASRYVSMKVYDLLTLVGRHQLEQFLHTSSSQYFRLAGLRQQLYEYLCRDILIKGGSFQRRLLTKDNRKCRNVKTVNIPRASNVIKDFTRLDDAYPPKRKHSNGVFFMSNYEFEAVDLWIQGCGMFQITTTKDCQLNSQVHEVSKKCKSNVIYFVVPDELTFQEYRYVELDEPNSNVKKASIVQYVLLVPPTDDI